MLPESDQEPRQGSRRVGVWDAAHGVGRVHPNRPFGTFFSWLEDERMRGLGSQREEGMLCGKNGMNRDRDRNEQVTEDRKAQGQRPREKRSGQTRSNRVRTMSQKQDWRWGPGIKGECSVH